MTRYINQLNPRMWKRLLRKDECGQDLIEYALLVGFMVLTISVVLPNNLMPTVSNIFSRIIVIFGTLAGS